MTNKTSKPLISIVIPAYNEEGNLPELYKRLGDVIDSQEGYEFEHIFKEGAKFWVLMSRNATPPAPSKAKAKPKAAKKKVAPVEPSVEAVSNSKE